MYVDALAANRLAPLSSVAKTRAPGIAAPVARPMAPAGSCSANLGMTIDDVILRFTSNPSYQIKLDDHGTLSVGAEADVAVLRLERGNFGFTDVLDARMTGTQRLGCDDCARCTAREEVEFFPSDRILLAGCWKLEYE